MKYIIEYVRPSCMEGYENYDQAPCVFFRHYEAVDEEDAVSKAKAFAEKDGDVVISHVSTYNSYKQFLSTVLDDPDCALDQVK
jgi:hypothetical protein